MSIRKSVLLCIVVLLTLHSQLSAQDKMDLKFGKITPQEFKLEGAKFDTSAGAVYLADIGLTEFEGNTKSGYSVVFKRHVRIKILNKQGFDAANFSVLVYDFGDVQQKLEKLKAVTYNLEGGQIVETKLDEKSVFKDKLDKYYSTRKFTLPGVKEGSIIEVTYNLKSDNYIRTLPSWDFQGKYPRLWSEYEVRIPQFLDYIILNQGSHPYHIRKTNTGFKYYTIIHDLGTQGNAMDEVKATVYEHRMVMKDVPPLKEESFVTTLENFNAKVEFQLSRIREPYKPTNIMGTWFIASQELMKDEDFGAALEKANNWLDDDMKTIVAGATTQLEKARKIYNYVRSNFTCTDHEAKFLQKSLKDVFKTKNGNVCEINMLMMVMLRHEGINVEPVMLSTRDHGITHSFYPLMERFNYVIAGATIDSSEYYLDASEPRLGFGKLPIRCYNGQARFISTVFPDAVYFLADSLRESKMTSVFIANGENKKMVGAFTTKLGYYESLKVRDRVSEKGKDELLKDFKKAYPTEYSLSDLELDSLNNLEEPLQIRYNIDLASFEDDIIYFSPMLVEGYKDNYFKSEQRTYPVQMPYTIDEIYVFNMEIPAGYEVDELPKSAKVNFNEDEGSFEYLISKGSNTIMMRSRIKLNKANYLPEDYEGLRSFFDYVVKKHSEQIVFKKKK